MTVKNLNDLKEKIIDGKAFRIIDHHRIEKIGVMRIPSVVSDNGFFANRLKAIDDIDATNMLGAWLEYGDEADWEFNDNICTLYTKPTKSPNPYRQVIISFVFLEDKNICCQSCKHCVSHDSKTTCAKSHKQIKDDYVCDKYQTPKEKTKFTMVIGLPFSGKSDWIKTQDPDNYSNNFIPDHNQLIQQDEPEKFKPLYNTMLLDLKAGSDVIFEAMNLTIADRKIFLDQIKELDVQKIAVIAAVSLSETIKRSQESNAPIDAKTLHELYHSFEKPQTNEGFDQILYFHEGRLKR